MLALTVLSTVAAAALVRDREPPSLTIVPVAVALDELEANGPCSAGRWPVKSLTDPGASSVELTPSSTTIGALGLLPRPSSGLTDSTARLPAERQVATVMGTLYADHLEADLDIHLVVHDPSDHSASLIAELPDPRCTAKSPPALRALMTAARDAYVRACGPPSGNQGDYFLDGTAQVTGVRLFDTFVGQFGRAPNAIELHPVLGFKILGPCRKQGGSTRFSLTSSIVEASTLSGAVTWSATLGPGSPASSSLVFLVDGERVGAAKAAGGRSQMTLDTAKLVDGAHAFAVSATLANGSTNLLTNHVQTRNGTKAPKQSPTIGITPAAIGPGGTIEVRMRGFAPQGTIVAAATSLNGRRWARASTRAGSTGTSTVRLRVPRGAPPGVYRVTACQSNCALVAKGRFSVRR